MLMLDHAVDFHLQRVAVLCGIMLAMAICALAQEQRPVTVPLARMVPASRTRSLLAADSSWWGTRLSAARQDIVLRSALDGEELLWGISLEKDILPWSGQCALLRLEDSKSLLLLEILDRTAFTNTLPVLQAKLEKHFGTDWAATSYQNIPLRYSSLPVTNTHLAWGVYGGWLAIGIGDGVIRAGIDVCNGKIPSLQQNADWVKATAALPAARDLFVTLHPAGELNDTLVVCSLSGTASERRIDVIATPLSAEKRLLLRTFKASLTPLNEKMLEKLPTGSCAALLISNPGKWLPVIKQEVLSRIRAPLPRLGIAVALRTLTPILSGCAGELALTESWTKTHGFNLFTLYDARGPYRAYSQVNRLTDIFADRGYTVEEKKDISYLHLPTGDQYCWTTDDHFVRFASDPALLPSTGQASLLLPPETKGADAVLLANLADIPVGTAPNVYSGINLLGYCTIAPDGATAHAVLQVRNWDDTKANLTLKNILSLLAFP